MATYTRIIIPGHHFLIYIKDLAKKYGINCYVEYRNAQKKAVYKKVDLESTLNSVFNENYRCFFLCAKEVNINDHFSFYNDEIVSDVIECFSEFEKKTERIDCRILSKKPNDSIRLFSNALNKKLKKDVDFGQGVLIGKHFDKQTFYLKKKGPGKNNEDASTKA